MESHKGGFPDARSIGPCHKRPCHVANDHVTILSVANDHVTLAWPSVHWPIVSPLKAFSMGSYTVYTLLLRANDTSTHFQTISNDFFGVPSCERRHVASNVRSILKIRCSWILSGHSEGIRTISSVSTRLTLGFSGCKEESLPEKLETD